jgi:hypothetical protein
VERFRSVHASPNIPNENIAGAALTTLSSREDDDLNPFMGAPRNSVGHGQVVRQIADKWEMAFSDAPIITCHIFVTGEGMAQTFVDRWTSQHLKIREEMDNAKRARRLLSS